MTATDRRVPPTGVVVAPSLFAADQLALGQAAEDLERAGAQALHIDVMDGRFVPKVSVGLPIIAALRERCSCVLDVHLQVRDPERHVERVADLGADIITVHVEATRHLHRVVEEVRGTGAAPGVAVNPGTRPEAVSEVVGDVDFVWVMTHDPATVGFVASGVAKVGRVRALLDAAGAENVRVAADGGVSKGNARALVDAGADWLVAGSGVFGAPQGPGAGLVDLVASARS